MNVQGIVWIKERESQHNLQVVRMGAASTVTAMERAMEAGHSVLVENMGENIDAVLNPVITRSTFKKASSSSTHVKGKWLSTIVVHCHEPIWHFCCANLSAVTA